MLRVEEASYLAAQTISARQRAKKVEETVMAQDAMVAAEKQAYDGTNGPAFVAAKKAAVPTEPLATAAPPQAINSDEIQISDDEI